MNSERKTGRRRTQAEAEQVLADFLHSGLAHEEFCRRQGICRSTLYRYLKKGQNQGEAPAAQLVPVEFVEVSGQARSEGGALAVLVGNGRKVEVGRGFDADTLEQVLRVLERM